MNQNQTTISTRVCIAGGGPAGIMLGYLLARAGIDVTVLEKWPDFFRDFRGDTIHPSTMDVLDELGFLEKFLQLPHNETRYVQVTIGSQQIIAADFTHLKTKCKFIAFIPQWDFLNFLATEAKQYPTFHLMMDTEASDLVRDNAQIAGVKVQSKGQTFEIRSELVIDADGRHSIIREKAQLAVQTLGAPIDVLWFRLSRKLNDPPMTLGRANFGKLMFMFERGDYWQCGFVIKKGAAQLTRNRGLENFRIEIVQLAPFLADRVEEISDWNQVKLLTVTVDHLKQWYASNLLCIGDAAHAMSPIGGVGINLAIQDAVAAGNILIPALKRGKPVIDDLKAVQVRREIPTRRTQGMQVFIQDHIIKKVFENSAPIRLPWYANAFLHLPLLNRIPARVMGLGFQPEHVNTDLFGQPETLNR